MATPADAHGRLTLTRADDGTVTVTSGANRIALGLDVLAHLDLSHITDSGLLQVDTAGEWLYRPVAFGRRDGVLVCERVCGQLDA